MFTRVHGPTHHSLLALDLLFVPRWTHRPCPWVLCSSLHFLGKKHFYYQCWLIYDQYTEPKGIEITYYKQPNKFSLFTGSPCQLPIDSFEELVSGAVDLYVQYVAGAESRKRQLEEARRQAAKEQEANAARRGRNND